MNERSFQSTSCLRLQQTCPAEMNFYQLCVCVCMCVRASARARVDVGVLQDSAMHHGFIAALKYFNAYIQG